MEKFHSKILETRKKFVNKTIRLNPTCRYEFEHLDEASIEMKCGLLGGGYGKKKKAAAKRKKQQIRKEKYR